MSGRLHFTAPLFVPANRPERFSKAALSGADAIILDLEDAVAPCAKDDARALLDTGFTDLPVLVRVNAWGTHWHRADMNAVLQCRPAAIILPKAEYAAIETVLASLPDDIFLLPLIETARGLAEARASTCFPAVKRLIFGSVDYCSDLGCAHTRDALLAARSELVLASRLGDLLPPVDGVTTAIDDAAAISDDARNARSLGFTGKLCIHPRQVASVIEGFCPAPEEIDWAHNVLSADDGGAVAVDGQLVDDPVRMRARSILKLAGEMA